MTYAVSSALQKSIFERLTADTVIASQVGAAIYDAVPTGEFPETFISLGAERVRDASDQTGNGAVHRIDITVRTEKPGFAAAKGIAVAVSDALHNADLALERGRLVYLRFLRADARMIGRGSGREIRMQFNARVDDQ